MKEVKCLGVIFQSSSTWKNLIKDYLGYLFCDQFSVTSKNTAKLLSITIRRLIIVVPNCFRPVLYTHSTHILSKCVFYVRCLMYFNYWSGLNKLTNHVHTKSTNITLVCKLLHVKLFKAKVLSLMLYGAEVCLYKDLRALDIANTKFVKAMLYFTCILNISTNSKQVSLL